MNKETFYFSHDYNTRSDIKIKKLISKHGYLGYGIYWAIVEDLYQNANALPLDCDCIAYDMRCDVEVVESIVKDFELFVIEGNVFGSLSVQRRLDKRAERSRKARKSAMKRWGNNANAMRTHSDSNANALRTECEPNAIKERKGKDSKGNNTIDDFSSEKPTERIFKKDIDEIYKAYPSRCPIQNRSLGKSHKDKDKIKALLKTNSKEKLLKTIELYASDCKKTGAYMKNLATFLNNLPDTESLKEQVKQPIHQTDY